MILNTHIEALRIQARFATDFDSGDVPKRIANAAIGAGCLWYFDARFQGLAVFSAILALEWFGWWLRRIAPQNVSDYSRTLILLVHFRVLFAVALFTLTAVLILFRPSQTALVVGLLFLSGTVIHSLVGHALIHAINWLTLIVFALAMLAFSFAFLSVDYASPTSGERLAMAGFCVVWVLSLVLTVHRGGGTRAAYAEAISAAERQVDILDYLASHDALTGLLNRRAFDETARDSMQFEGGAAVLLLDLDGFKPINDTYGHAAGDAVLAAFGTRLAERAAPHLVARLGGDEFAVFIQDATDRAPVEALVDQLTANLVDPVFFEDTEISFGVSIGCAFQTPDTPDFETLCRMADAEMYRTKSRLKRRTG